MTVPLEKTGVLLSKFATLNQIETAPGQLEGIGLQTERVDKPNRRDLFRNDRWPPAFFPHGKFTRLERFARLRCMAFSSYLDWISWRFRSQRRGKIDQCWFGDVSFESTLLLR
jgi:hypothetical protein